MATNEKDMLHELHIDEVEQKMNLAFNAGNLDLAHEYCNEFGQLIQNRSKEMVDSMERVRQAAILRHVPYGQNRRVGIR